MSVGVNLRNVMLACLVMPPAFYIGTHWGIEGVAYAWLLAYPVVLFVNMRRMLAVIGLRAALVVARVNEHYQVAIDVPALLTPDCSVARFSVGTKSAIAPPSADTLAKRFMSESGSE